MVKADEDVRQEKAKWELEHDLWDFLTYISGQSIVLARWETVAGMDRLMPLASFSERRNLPRSFLDLETWEESGKKADEMFEELRRKNRSK